MCWSKTCPCTVVMRPFKNGPTVSHLVLLHSDFQRIQQLHTRHSCTSSGPQQHTSQCSACAVPVLNSNIVWSLLKSPIRGTLIQTTSYSKLPSAMNLCELNRMKIELQTYMHTYLHRTIHTYTETHSITVRCFPAAVKHWSYCVGSQSVQKRTQMEPSDTREGQPCSSSSNASEQTHTL